MAFEPDATLVSLGMSGTIHGSSTYRYTPKFKADEGEYRLRLFLDYSRTQDYVDPLKKMGLYVNVENAVYDDWGCSFRNPMIDSGFCNGHTINFNSEITVPIGGVDVIDIGGFINDVPVMGDSSIHLVQEDETHEYILGGASCIGNRSTENSPSFLVEKKTCETEIESVTFIDGLVKVSTKTPHGFRDGDAITIAGLPVIREHSTGSNGERYNGIYSVNVIDEYTFTYATKFYSHAGQNMSYSGKGVASKWIACAYTVDKKLTVDNEHRLIAISWPDNDFVRGDFVTLSIGPAVLYNLMVDTVYDSDGKPNVIVFHCTEDEMSVLTGEETSGKLYYSGRVPSSAIPVNYSDDVDNRSSYDHTMTSFLGEPVEDTFFDANRNGTTFSTSESLRISNDSAAMFKVCPPSVPYSQDAHAMVRVYVKCSTAVSTPLGLYEVTTNEWSATNSYGSATSLIADNPISVLTIENFEYSPDELGYYAFSIPSDIVNEWVLGGKSTVSLAIRPTVQMDDDAYTLIGSNESNNPIQFILSTGRSSIMDPDPVNVKVVPPNASVGDTISVMVDGDGQFNEMAQNNIVRINGIDAIVMGGDQKTLRVIVPDGISGTAVVTVYSKIGEKLLTYSNPATMNVMGQAATKNRILNEKKRPGEILSKVSTTALYCRDFGYNNFTEITDENSLIQNIYSILLTRKGERLFNSDFGTTIEDRVFSIMNEADETAILKECFDAIEKYEPRVEIDYENSHVDVEYDANAIVIYIAVILPSGTATYITLPFKNRGEMV